MTSLTSLTSPPTIPCPRLPLLGLQRCPSQASTWGPSCWQFPAPGYKPSHPPRITTWLSPGPPFNCHPSTEAFTDHTAENGNPAYTLVFLFLPAGWLICFYTAYISICHMMYSIILLTAFYPRLQHKVNEKDLYLFWSVQDRQSPKHILCTTKQVLNKYVLNEEMGKSEEVDRSCKTWGRILIHSCMHKCTLKHDLVVTLYKGVSRYSFPYCANSSFTS